MTYEELVHAAREAMTTDNPLGQGPHWESRQVWATLAVADRLDRLGDLFEGVIYEGDGHTDGVRVSR